MADGLLSSWRHPQIVAEVEAFANDEGEEASVMSGRADIQGLMVAVFCLEEEKMRKDRKEERKDTRHSAYKNLKRK